MFQPLSIFNRNRNLPTVGETTRDPFFRLQHEMNRLFDEAFTSFGGGTLSALSPTVNPICDLRETDRAFECELELPGVKEDDIDVQVQDNLLTVRGEKRSEKKQDDKGYHYFERAYGSFARTIPLPTEIDPDKVEAVFRDGVLKLTLPKLPEAQTKTKRISIKRG